MADVRWSDTATDHIEQIVAYIDVFDPTTADKISRRLIALGESLSTIPNRGRPAGNRTRELVGVPPFVLQYEVADDEVIILAVRHGSRRPLDA